MEQGKLMDNKNLKETTQTDETRRMVEVEDIRPTAVMDTAELPTQPIISNKTRNHASNRESIKRVQGVPRKIVRYLLILFLFSGLLLFYPGETRFERVAL